MGHPPKPLCSPAQLAGSWRGRLSLTFSSRLLGRAPPRPPRSGFGAGPPAPAGARPDSGTGTGEFVADVCQAAWAGLYAQKMEFREGKSGSRETSWRRGYVRGQERRESKRENKHTSLESKRKTPHQAGSPTWGSSPGPCDHNLS
uniref:Uncharacterized protein n=1 Tax=Mustela putorius furo TaxID=9669 RepID=M3Y330_MUSPF